MYYQRHPISSAFPDLRAEDVRDLKDSIRTLGVLEPIAIFEGMILDGWQRYTVAKQLGVTCPVRQFAGSRQDAIEYAVAKQTRRNMTKLERAAVLVELHASQLAPRGNHSKSASTADFVTLKALAAKTGIGERTLRRARRLEQQAIPSVKIVLSKGLISAEEAEKIASEPRADQLGSLRYLLEMKRLKKNPVDLSGFVHVSGKYIIISKRDRDLAHEIVRHGVPELCNLVSSGKNIGLIAAACVARRPPNEQRDVLASALWVQALRHLPYGRFERRQLRTNPSYFERG